MIKVTRPDGSNVWINPDQIVRIEPITDHADVKAEIVLPEGMRNRVLETPEDVLRLLEGTK